MSHPRPNHVATVCAFLFLAFIQVSHATAQSDGTSAPCEFGGPEWYRTYAQQTHGDGRIYAAATATLPDSAWARGAAERRAWADLSSTVVTNMQAVASFYFEQWALTRDGAAATEIADSTYFNVRHSLPQVIRTWNSTNCPESDSQGATQYHAYTVVGADLSPLIHRVWATLQPRLRPASDQDGMPSAASFEQAVFDRLGVTRGSPDTRGAVPGNQVAAKSTGPAWYKTYGQDLKGNGRLYRGGSSTSVDVGDACQAAVNKARDSLAAGLRQSLEMQIYTYLETVNRGAEKALADTAIVKSGRTLRNEAKVWNSADELDIDANGTTRHHMYIVVGADPRPVIRSAWSAVANGDQAGAGEFETKVLDHLGISGIASDVGVVAEGATGAPCRIEGDQEQAPQKVEPAKITSASSTQAHEKYGPGRRRDLLTIGIRGLKDKTTPFGDLVGWEWGHFGLRIGHVEGAPQMPSKMIISLAGLSLRQPVHVGASYILDVYALGLGPGSTFSEDIGPGSGLLAKDYVNFADAGLRYIRNGLCISAGYRWAFVDFKWSDAASDVDKAMYDLSVPEGAFVSLSAGGHRVRNQLRYVAAPENPGSSDRGLGQSARPFRIAGVGAVGLSMSDYADITNNAITGETIYNITGEAALQLSMGFARSWRLATEVGQASRQEGPLSLTSRDYHATLQWGGGSWPGHGAYGYLLAGGDIINLLSAEWDPEISGFPGSKEDVLEYMNQKQYGWHAGVGFVAGSKWLFFSEVQYGAMVTNVAEFDAVPLRAWSIRMGLGR